MKLKGVTLLGIILMVLALLLQIGLYGFSYTGYEKDAPVLVMYGTEDSKFPNTIFRMAMGRAGFQTLILDKDLEKSLSIGEEISLPRGYRSQSIVILAQGSAATSSLKLFDTDEDTLGFVLVNPEFETNYSMEGMSTEFPTHNVAIFTDNSDPKSDSKIMYERLSGEDTLFGITSRPGGVTSSEVYMNPKGNRYLSVSSVDKGDGALFYMSPSFQIELADYLCANYMTDTNSPSKAIIAWYVILIMSAALFISGLFLFLSKIPVVRYKMVTDNKDKIDTFTTIVIVSLAAIAACVFIVLLILGGKSDLILMGVGYLPCVMIALMGLIRLPFLIKNIDIKRPHKAMSVAYILTIAILVFFLMLANNTIGIRNAITSNLRILFSLLAAVIDLAGILIVARCDGVSRIKGLGGCSYYGKYIMVIFTLVPSAVLFFAGVLVSNSIATALGLMGFACAAIPFLASLPVKRHSNSTTLTAVTHAGIYLILLILAT